jgi:hypothetical protein
VKELSYCGGRCVKDEREANVESEEIFRYKLGKWVLLRDECIFTSIDRLGKDTSVHQYLLESIDNWVDKKEEFQIQEFVSEMCEFIKSKNKDLYFHLMEKCALKGINVGEGIFEALSRYECEEVIDNLQYGTGEE